MSRIWIGIDPGEKGYSCALNPNEKVVGFISNKELPHIISYWYQGLNEQHDVQMTVIEDVHSIFGVSAKSNFNFGFNTGLVTGIVQGLGLPLAKISPKKWQKTINVKTKGKDIKKEVAKIAQSLYPHVELRGPRGGLIDGKSDALMIAHYSYLTYR